MSEIETLLKSATKEIAGAADAAALEALRVKYLGRKGLVREQFNKVKSAPAEERGAAGREANQLKYECNGIFGQYFVEELENPGTVGVLSEADGNLDR